MISRIGQQISVFSTVVVTNLYFLFVGLHQFLIGSPWPTWASIGFLGVASGIHHYVGSEVTSDMDWIGMYGVFSWLAVYSIVPDPSKASLIWGGVFVVSIIIHLCFRDLRYIILGVLAGGLLLVFLVTGEFRMFLDSSFIFAVSFIALTIAESSASFKIYSNLHGIWHVGASYGIDKIATFLTSRSDEVANYT